ncbi:MAG: AI-2E family transporter, partial [Cyclobacteriaceae bacterium]|nr:AI-2E family transporter [Cyclobacteriaceae bacterium]
MTESFTNSQLFKTATFLFCASLIIAIFMLGKPFLVPLAWGLMIALASIRMLDKIEYKFRIKRIIVTITFVLLVLVLVIMVFFFFYIEIRTIVSGMPEFAVKVSSMFHNISVAIRGYGVTVPDHIDHDTIHTYVSGHGDLITRILSGFGQGIGKIFLVAIYLFFLIYYRDNYLTYLEQKEKTPEKIEKARSKFNDILDIINNFLFGLVIVTLIMAITLYVIFLLIGLKYALFFAVLVGLLSLIPYLGIPVGLVIVFIFAAITNDGYLVPILSAAGILFSNILQESIFKPLIIGDKIKLNAFFIFLSVIVGGLIWGIAGMILFMP